MKNVDFAGDSEAVIASAEADQNAGGDGPDQEHLGHHPDLHGDQDRAQTGRNRTQKTALKVNRPGPSGTNQGRKYICQSS